ncbi:MAG: zinc-binding dehydrogenase ['Candidatus Kapabacteria' thiocyanatum]|uniref:Enoyl reductase (ER) domain-containing protein n=1 Tax=Candidatus Kapaibacterium thiocyanatum TaxID=1895771 RepID=A0A1M3KWJ3_9BACT|nr:zinc-binding dehydrogenase ['Candidatus Kapabacteria' thiocyanatum]OJX56760.1 MAG: hypothetical protein BGO89_09505 ['Candidatus Kapabacteria' thiocyanatum]
MKALLLTDSSFSVEDVPPPVPGEHDALVKLKTAALNHRDLFIREGLYAKIVLPAILGSDGCGVVEQTPEFHHLIGRRVIIDPSMDWGPDPMAQGRDYSILGMPRSGTLAEYVAVPAANLYEAPAHLTDEQAAALPLSGVTAWRALMVQGKCSEHDTVLVTGTGGGVATMAVQFAVASGARVLVTSSSNDKLARAIKLGAQGGVNYTSETWTKDLMAIYGQPDLIIDGAGGVGFNDLTNIVKPGGRIVLYGATRGTTPNANMHRIFWKQLRITGSTMGTSVDFGDMISFVADKQIVPEVDSVIPLDRVVEAFDRMRMGAQYGKLVVRIS